MTAYDIAIIGGGVVGCALAHELCQYDLKVVVLEQGCDVASGASKANSGVLHSGINSAVDSLKARFCVEGNTMMDELSQKLGFDMNRVGKYVIAQKSEEISELECLHKIGRQNGVPDLEIVDGKSVMEKEPNISCVAGLWVPTAGIMLPYQFSIALAEHAVINGVTFILQTKVTSLRKKKDCFVIGTSNGEISSYQVVNAAGIHCREIASMIEEPDFQVYPCRGEYVILDKRYSNLINSMIYPVPDKKRGVLGVHITPTVEGNILLGPSAEFTNDTEDTRTTDCMMKTLLSEAKQMLPELPVREVITAYAGVRCKLASEEEGGWADYKVEYSAQTPGLLHLLGIESPGLTAAPALAKHVANMLMDSFEFKPKKGYKETMPKQKRFEDMTVIEQSKMVQMDPRWGRIVCRCEHITEAEVIRALHNPLNAHSLSAVKYRCRVGMGRCQGGFCTQHVVRLMKEELGLDPDDIRLKSKESYLFDGRTREVLDETTC